MPHATARHILVSSDELCRKLMSQLRKTKNNYEFLVQVSKNTPGGADVD